MHQWAHTVIRFIRIKHRRLYTCWVCHTMRRRRWLKVDRLSICAFSLLARQASSMRCSHVNDIRKRSCALDVSARRQTRLPDCSWLASSMFAHSGQLAVYRAVKRRCSHLQAIAT